MNRTGYLILPVLTLLALLLALAGALLLAPTEATMGDVQRIFYFHLGCAAAAFASLTGVLCASLLFLILRKQSLDHLAAACAEVGILFTTLVLITGPLWARPVWGKWWVWDPRLTTTLILWFLYAGYLVLRQALGGHRSGPAAAVFAILAYVDVPVVYFSVSWWRGVHPQVLTGGGGLERGMILPLLVAVTAFLVLAGVLIRERFRVENAASRVDMIEFALEDIQP